MILAYYCKGKKERKKERKKRKVFVKVFMSFGF